MRSFVTTAHVGPTPTARIPSLDGLRAVSILLVLLGHLGYADGFHAWWSDAYAHAGVRTFFVLSGYLITKLLLGEHERSGTIRIGRFYVRRAWRILPVAYAYVGIITLVSFAHLSWRDMGLAWTYLTSYTFLFGPPHWNVWHLWSISVEEQFYLIWPLLVAWRPRWAARAAWAAVVVAPLCRYAFRAHGMGLMALFGAPAVVDSLAIGCLFALHAPRLSRWVSTRRWTGAAWVGAAVAPQLIPFIGEHPRVFVVPALLQAYVWTLFSLCVAVGMLWAIGARPRLLNHRLAVWIGTLSYGLYIWQMPFMNPDARIRFPLNVLLAVGAAIASYYLLEQPLLWLRDRRAERQRAALQKAA